MKIWASVCVFLWGSVCSATPLTWLTARTADIVNSCTIVGVNGTTLYTPDASHSYGAQWTRDFAYALMFAPQLVNASTISPAVRATFLGQRDDGCMPDRVQSNGVAVYSPGGASSPFADHAWDNMPFSALLLSAAARHLQSEPLFCDLEPAARRALDFVNRSTAGLVFNDVAKPNCTYGFTDTVAKTGHLLFTSLLFHDAASQMAALSSQFGCGNATQYAADAAAAVANLDLLSDPTSPLWLAASVDNALPDVWGSLYAVYLNLSTPARQQAVTAYVAQNLTTSIEEGQVRNLPQGLYWTRCFVGCAAHGTYQNGGFWATPIPYLVKAFMSTGLTTTAAAIVNATIASFQTGGIYEDIDNGNPVVSRGVLNYTASATNVLWGLQALNAGR